MSIRYHQHYHWMPSVPLLNICWAEHNAETGQRWDNELAITGPRAVALHTRLLAADHEGSISIIEMEIEHNKGMEDV